MNRAEFPKSLNILRKFSRQRLTGTDFVSLCDANDIIVKITPDCDRGFYYFVSDRHYIAISSKLNPTQRSFVGWHEFAHFLQNFYDRKPIAAFSDLVPDKASEKLADIFAMIALRPDHIRITGAMDFLRMIMSNDE